MNKLQYGMPTLLELPTLAETATLCHNLGLHFVEINMNAPQFQAEKLDASELLSIAQQHGIFYTVHLDDAFSPCDFNARVAKAYTDTALDVVAICKKINAPVINMHLNSGAYFTLPERKVYIFEEHMDTWLRSLCKFRDAMTAAIGNANIKICVENTGGGFDPSAFTYQGVLTLLHSPVFALTYDIGHNAKRHLPEEAAFIENSDRLHHMHCHDVMAGGDHLPLGAGELDISRYLDVAHQHNCRVLLETKTIAGLKQSVIWLKERNYL
jgi:sugar phosphate isomerase/epimerase